MTSFPNGEPSPRRRRLPPGGHSVRREALDRAIESLGSRAATASNAEIVDRAAAFELFLRGEGSAAAGAEPVIPAQRPAPARLVALPPGEHYALERGRTTPSGARACELCGEKWPCSHETKRRAGSA